MKPRSETLIGWGIWVAVFAVLAVMGETDFHLDHTILFFLVVIALTIFAIAGLSRLLSSGTKQE